MSRRKDFKNDSEYIDYLEGCVVTLEEALEKFDKDSFLVKLLIAQYQQVEDLADMVKAHRLTRADLESKDDKYFDRIMGVTARSKQIAETIIYLFEKIGPEKAQAATKQYGTRYDKVMSKIAQANEQ